MKVSMILLAVSLSLSAPALALVDLVVTVAGLPTIEDADSFVIKTVITNKGDQSATLLNTPNSVLTPQWKTNTFNVVSANGTAAHFKGMRVKWHLQGAVDAKDFTVLGAGKSIEFEQDLNDIYSFEEGAYNISVANALLAVSPAGDVVSYNATVTPLHTKVSAKAISARTVGSPAHGKRYPLYASCTAAQQVQISEAVQYANYYIRAAYWYLASVSFSTPRFTTWFGPRTAASASLVKSHFVNMFNDATATTYHCVTSCHAPHVFAYVFPASPGVIYLCPGFWTAPLYGTNSKAGTIVHAQSHFTVNGGTLDFAFGKFGCMTFLSPAQRIMNADCHEYFAENTPSLG